MNPTVKLPFLLIVIASLFASVQVGSANFLSESREWLDQQTLDAQREASSRALSLASQVPNPTPPLPTSINMSAGDFTLNGAPGETVTLNLSNFVLRGSASFTLQGTATTSFIINVSRKFSLSGNATITLTDGVDSANVLFNVTGKGKVSMKGNSLLQGRLFSALRTVKLSQYARVYGWVVARKIALKGDAQITPPPIVSP